MGCAWLSLNFILKLCSLILVSLAIAIEFFRPLTTIIIMHPLFAHFLTMLIVILKEFQTLLYSKVFLDF